MKIEILSPYIQHISLVSLSVAERDVSTLTTELPCIFLPFLSNFVQPLLLKVRGQMPGSDLDW